MHLGRRLPVASCGLPRDGAGLPEFPLFGLAPRGVYRAAGVTAGTGGLLPHRSTLTVQRPRTTALRTAVLFLWHLPGVSPTGRYPARGPWSPDFPLP